MKLKKFQEVLFVFCGNVQVLIEDNQSVEPVETTVGNECHRLLPSACGQRWWDLRLTVHNCTWFLCDLLNQLKATQLPTVTLVITLNEVFLQLVEVACKWTDDVRTPRSSQLLLPLMPLIMVPTHP